MAGSVLQENAALDETYPRINFPHAGKVLTHRLLLRAGYIRPLGAGIYSLLPLGMSVNMRVTQVIREEMDAIGCQELLMPVMHPEDLWRQTGRNTIPELSATARSRPVPTSGDSATSSGTPSRASCSPISRPMRP